MKIISIWRCNFVSKSGVRCRCNIMENDEKDDFKRAYEEAKLHSKRHGVKIASDCFDRMRIILVKKAGI